MRARTPTWSSWRARWPRCGWPSGRSRPATSCARSCARCSASSRSARSTWARRTRPPPGRRAAAHYPWAIMSNPLLEQVRAALGTVNDPEIKRPITDLGMVESVDVDTAGVVRLTVLLTVAGCPMKDTINRDVNAAVRRVPGVRDVELRLGVMSAEQRAELKDKLSDGHAQREITFAQPGSLTKVFAVASGKGGVGKSSVTVNLALAMA